MGIPAEGSDSAAHFPQVRQETVVLDLHAASAVDRNSAIGGLEYDPRTIRENMDKP